MEKSVINRIVFISDIHSNWNFLNQLKSVIEQENADQIFFLGDAIGYYDEPDKVIGWLRSVNARCISGNHEKYYLGRLHCSPELESIYQTAKNHREISAAHRRFVESWPDLIECEIAGKRLLAVHGAFDNSESRIYHVNDLDRELIKKYDFYAFGHTHIPLIHYHYGCCVINPGSIGQPRDHTATPSYAVLDIQGSEVTIKKKAADASVYCSYLQKNHYDEKVIQILNRK